MRTIWKVILGILIGLVILVVQSFALIFLFTLLINCDQYYYNVPLKATVTGSNLVLNPLNVTPENVDILILTKEKISEIPLNCSLNKIKFDFGDPGLIFKDKSLSISNGTASRGGYGSTKYLLANYSNPNSKEIILELKDDSSLKKSERLLSSEKDEMYIQYWIRPFFTESELNYYSNYPKKDIDIYGCVVLEREKDISGGVLEINGINKNTNLKHNMTICLIKQEYANPGAWIYSNEDCTFFEISSNIHISTEIDLSKGQGHVNKRSCF